MMDIEAEDDNFNKRIGAMHIEEATDRRNLFTSPMVVNNAHTTG